MLEDIVKWFGNQRAMAKCLGVTDVAVSLWKKEGIPAMRAIEIEEMTRGHFRAVDIINNNNGLGDTNE